eukprot:6209102-Pyramimonas_sp.AAC.1
MAQEPRVSKLPSRGPGEKIPRTATGPGTPENPSDATLALAAPATWISWAPKLFQEAGQLDNPQ